MYIYIYTPIFPTMVMNHHLEVSKDMEVPRLPPIAGWFIMESHDKTDDLGILFILGNLPIGCGYLCSGDVIGRYYGKLEG
jgi:hypothetical protein